MKKEKGRAPNKHHALYLALLLASGLSLSSCLVQPAPRDKELVRALLSLPSDNLAGSDGGQLLANRYDFDAWLLAQQKLPEHAIVVSMSGGATRAAVFAQSVLLALGQFYLPANNGYSHSLADNVIAISAVSGGAMTAAAYVLDRATCTDADTSYCDLKALGLKDPETNADSLFDREILEENLALRFIGQDLMPLNWPDRASRWQYYFDSYFRSAYPKSDGSSYSYADLGANSSIPFLVLNSTDILNDRTFSFVQDQFNDICADLNQLPLSVGVAAAGNFPYLSSDIELKNFRAVDQCANAGVLNRETAQLQTEMENPYGMTSARGGGRPVERAGDGQRYDLETAVLARYRLAMRVVTPQNSQPPKDGSDPTRRIDWLHLYDGGVADNLGLWPLVRLLNKATLEKLRAKGVKDITVIVINARWDWTPKRNLKNGSPYFTQLFLDTAFDPINQVTALSEEFGVNSLRSEYHELCHRENVKAACPSVPEEIFPVVLDFDQLVGSPDLATLREEVKNYGDDEWLGLAPRNHRDANDQCMTKLCVVARAGRKLLARNPCFKAFVNDARVIYKSNQLDKYPGPSADPNGGDPFGPTCKKIALDE